jgi:hypothetical protein
MEKYSDYTIVHAADVNELSTEVKQYLKDGWVLLGAPFSHAAQSGIEICQGLIKPDITRPGSVGFQR